MSVPTLPSLSSVPLHQGWRLRVVTGTSAGREFPLPPGRYVLGSASPASIVVPDPSIAPQHVELDVRADQVLVRDVSGGRGIQVNGAPASSGRLMPGDSVAAGTFGFVMANASLPAAAPAGPPSVPLPPAVQNAVQSTTRSFKALPTWGKVAIVSGAIAFVLFLLTAATENVNLVPVTLVAMSAVVPATMICFLVERYDKTGISFRTLSLTFVAGGTLGIISTIVLGSAGGAVTGGLALLAIFAGLWEEPSKFLATSVRWKHPGYDRPMDGLILGTVSGLGFAVFETAGYGLRALLQGGFGELLQLMLIRGLASPFGHGLWTGITAAAFWQCGRNLRRAVKSRTFQLALLTAVGLHALWNLQALIPFAGWLCMIASGYLSVRIYRQRLLRGGYAP